MDRAREKFRRKKRIPGDVKLAAFLVYVALLVYLWNDQKMPSFCFLMLCGIAFVIRKAFLLASFFGNPSLRCIDKMDGQQFEVYLAKKFKELGYKVVITPYQGDQGADLIIEKDGIKTAVQAKRYSENVGNAAVQEIIAGKIYYGCDKAMVVTNSDFTKAAKDLARRANVTLWDRKLMKKKFSY